MEYIENSKELLSFIENSPSMFHSVETIKGYLDREDFIKLEEGSPWNIKKGCNYYVTRNDSSILAFKVGKSLKDNHYQIVASHGDSPTFKVKNVPLLKGAGKYLRLNTEAYGGMIDSTWLDRPLSLAGRVFVEEDGEIKSKLLSIDKDILLIPNVAIHLNRDANNGYKYNRQVDLLPLFSSGILEENDYNNMLGDYLDVKPEDIISKDLFLYNRQKGTIWGYKDEFISSPKLDNLQSAFTSLKAFLNGGNEENISVYVCFDNEEVGSNTKQGAMSTFMKDTFMRINNSLGYSLDQYYQSLAKSFMVSCDNAHAVHPNHPEMTDDGNKAFLNKGIVIKESANQKYTSDAFSQGVLKKILKDIDIPYQFFANRSNKQGGSTLGNISNVQVSLNAIDIGFPQLSMHSSYETGGAYDTYYGIKGLSEFYKSNIIIKESSSIKIEK